MEPVSFASASIQVVPVGGGGQELRLSTLMSVADGRALADALAWQRAQDHQVPAFDSADHVLELRTLVALIDEVETVAGQPHGGPIALTGGQMRLLAEASARYVATRDRDGHVPPRERERIDRLRALNGPLFELVARLAEAEASERAAHHGPAA